MPGTCKTGLEIISRPVYIPLAGSNPVAPVDMSRPLGQYPAVFFSYMTMIGKPLRIFAPTAYIGRAQNQSVVDGLYSLSQSPFDSLPKRIYTLSKEGGKLTSSFQLKRKAVILPQTRLLT
jgi:hypothetical protein